MVKLNTLVVQIARSVWLVLAPDNKFDLDIRQASWFVLTVSRSDSKVEIIDLIFWSIDAIFSGCNRMML